MRFISGLTAAFVFSIAAAHAQSPFDYPGSAAAQAMSAAGWTITAGVARHEASTTQCPALLPGFDALILTGPRDPNVIGTCTYKQAGGEGDTGIEVRRYIRDVGESQDAIDNDRTLMEPRANESAPFMMVRIQPIVTRDGKQGGRMVITKARGGFLVDCFGEAASLEKASEKIRLFCAN
jgi:hypothetical protein